jgi:hypothetical protein
MITSISIDWLLVLVIWSNFDGYKYWLFWWVFVFLYSICIAYLDSIE